MTAALDIALLLVGGVTWGMSLVAMHRAASRYRLVCVRGINGVAQLLARARVWRAAARLSGATIIIVGAGLALIIGSPLDALIMTLVLLLIAGLLSLTVWIDAHTGAQIERIVDGP